MAKRSSSAAGSSRSSNEPLDKHARSELRAELVARTTGSKTCVATVLQTLQQRGLLTDSELGREHELRELTCASHAHADAQTPYGPVVQDIPLEMNDGSTYKWEFCHPFAFIYYLTLKCSQFADMMARALATSAGILSLVLYGDEFTPGNALRHDSGRQVFSFYYAFLEWPTWILHKSDAWLCFGALRTSTIENVKGGISAVFAGVLSLMFARGSANFSSGVLIHIDGREKMARAILKGIIADEKGLKEAFDIKGASGTKPCISCQNIWNFIHKRRVAPGYRIALNNVRQEDWIPHTDESIFELHKLVSDIAASGPRSSTKVSKFQTDTGVNHNPLGLLGNPTLQAIVKPVTHYIRDWQHTYCSNGVASWHLAAVLHVVVDNPVLIRANIGLHTITEYCSNYKVPRCHGRINKYWFDPAYLAKDHVRHFASDVLMMVPFLLAFMVDVVQPLGVLLRDIEGLALLDKVLSFLVHAGRMMEDNYRELQSVVVQHLTVFAELYPNFIKVKFHHAGHLPRDLFKLGVCLSCFPLERKHKLLKSMIVYVFRSVEMTCIKDYVNHVVQQLVENRFEFRECWLEKPVACMVMGKSFSASIHAHNAAGEMHQDDVILAFYNGNVVVGSIDRFFQDDADIFARLCSFRARPGSLTLWDTISPERIFVPLPDVRANLKWARRNDSTIVVIWPAAVKLGH